MTRRLLLSYLAVTAIVLLVLEVPLGIFFQQRETERLAVNLERDATTLASLYEKALEEQVPPAPEQAEAYTAGTGVRVVLADANGISVIDTSEEADRDLSTRPEMKAALGGTRTTGVRHSDTLDADLLYVAIPVASGGRVYGALRLTIDTAEVRAGVTRFWWGLAGVAAVVLGAMALIGFTVARSVTRPLREVEQTAARFATGDLRAAPPDAHAPREIAELQAAMNSMARRLAQLLTEHRAFVADASHQLRTPLTALRLRLENLQSAAPAPGEARELGAALEEIQRLSALVDDLLHLAAAEQSAETAEYDLARLTRDRVDTWSAVAEAAEITVEMSAPAGPLFVRAVPNGIEQLLDNLLDNAITASPPRSSIHVTIQAGRAEHVLSIADEGPGMSDDLKRRALDRFWRADSSKAGSGLGLPIAMALVDASGGSLQLLDAPGGGLLARVTLPASHSPTVNASTH